MAAPAPAPAPAAGPVKLLSIDGGGVRGLSALVMLEQLMDAANDQRTRVGLVPQQPWEMFDMMGGTSTGGLIAIMLGRLRMTIDQCRKAYIQLSSEAFTEKNILSRAKEKVTVGPQFKTKPLEDAIKSIIGSDWATKLLKDEDPQCQVFVVSHLENISETAILRTYRNIRKPKALFDEMHIWEACRATSAALTFFEPITVGGSRYSDGGLMENNPVQHVDAEASEMFPGRERLLISLGTGTSKSVNFQPTLRSVAELLAKLATETERTADAFYRRDDSKAAKAGLYFRFNVPGLGDIGLEETKKLDDIKLETEKYLNGSEVGHKVLACVQSLSEGAVNVPNLPHRLQDTLQSTVAPTTEPSDLEERFVALQRG